MDKDHIHILLLEDNETDAILVQTELKFAMGDQISLVHAERLSDASRLIEQQSFDLILTDLRLPDSDGIDTVNRLRSIAANIPIAVLSFRDDERLAIQVIKAGAQDYLVKGSLTQGVLARVIRYSIERKRTEENARKAQQRFHTIFDKAPLGIALINLETGSFLDVNPMYSTIVCRSIDELLKINHSDIIHPLDLVSFERDISLISNHYIPGFRITMRILRPDNSIAWIEMSIAPFEVDESFNMCHLCMIEDITERKQMVENLRDLTIHLQEIREEERTRIGREIHDVLGGSLTVLRMDLDWLSKKITKDPMHERIDSMYQLTGEAIETARRVSINLRPNVLDNLGLVGAIEWQIREFEQRTNIKCHLRSAVTKFSLLNKGHETSIFRIIQEAFVNIARHAQASTVYVELDELNNNIFIMIKDNGIGITNAQLLNPKSFGIVGMNERIKQLGGKLDIQGLPSQGSTVTLLVPIDSSHDLSQEVLYDN